MTGLGFLGTYEATIDDKGRLRIPAKFRALLGEKFVVAQGADCCLAVYTEESWNALSADVLTRSPLDLTAQDFRRTLFPTAVEGEFDNAGRVLVPLRHRQYAQLKKDLIVVGNYDTFEIWNAEQWNSKNYGNLETRRSLQNKMTQNN